MKRLSENGQFAIEEVGSVNEFFNLRICRIYWNALKTKLITEGSELSQFLGQLKLPKNLSNIKG